MDSWYFNKIAGAALAALLLAFGAGTMADIIVGHPKDKAKPGYVLPVTAAPSGPAAKAPAAAFNYAELAPMLKTASAENGQAVFSQCRSCHTIDKGGRVLQGPNLWGVVGQKIAGSATFPRYSAALKAKQGTWTYEALATYLNNPAASIPGNTMGFQGIRNNADLADLLAYMRAQADAPVPLPN